MKNKKKTIMLIMVITISMVLLTWNKSYSYKMNDNEIEETEVERKEFGIYLQESGTTYKETDAFPNKGYLLNTTKTECHEYGNDTIIPGAVTQSLTNGVIDGSIIVTSQKSMYCKIYFDKDETSIVSRFNIKGKTSNNEDLNNGFTYQTSDLPITFDYTDKENNVVQYCVTETNNSDSCSWIQLNGKSGNYSIINTADGEKTLYMYLKDKANNISTTKTTNITVDKTLPQVTLTLIGTQASGTLQPGYTHTQQVTYNATITETNPDSYCVGENSCNNYSMLSSSSIDGSTMITNTEASHNVLINVKDKAGNVGSTTQSITLDTQNPTITLSNGITTETSIKVTVNANDVHGIASVTCTAVGNNETKTGTYNSTAKTCTFNGLKDNTTYSITGVATDNSGRKTTSTAINVTTIKKKLTGSDLIKDENRPNGLSTDQLGDMYRFVGTNETVNNWICFGYSDINKDCKNDSTYYKYRIIGITSDGHMKVLKNDSIGRYAWTSIKENSDIMWSQSDLFKQLNGNSNQNIFLGSNLYLNKSVPGQSSITWESLIENALWKVADIGGDQDDPQFNDGYIMPLDLYLKEIGSIPTISGWEGCYNNNPRLDSFYAKIGLLLLSDFFLSYKTGRPANEGRTGSWMTIDPETTNYVYDVHQEWTMTRYGAYNCEYDDDDYLESYSIDGWTITYHAGDGAGYSDIFNLSNVRPTFYLSTETVAISDGDGTLINPFIIVPAK